MARQTGSDGHDDRRPGRYDDRDQHVRVGAQSHQPGTGLPVELVYVNERLADLFGYAQSDLVGKSPLVLAGDAESETAVREALTHDFGDTDTFRKELTGRRADGAEIPIEIYGGSIHYEGEPGCIGVLWRRRESDATDEDG